ncbi:ANTAR domain-containing response regulator [Pararhodobacter oceanensis]|uniref:ANTAR domain-containing response regulator n=1 Tax=Pararhodobacter oceanensis TaxID=2172121 RepID=UPI003A907299
MKQKIFIPEFGGARAVILHRPHPTVDSLSRQLRAIGLSVEAHWPELPASVMLADYLFFDADMGCDEQFPWPAGEASMPMIALIGSEAPGRIEWALSHNAASKILKPVGDGGVFSGLLIARQTYDARKAMAAEIADLRARLSERQTVVQAVMLLARNAGSEDRAYDQLRQMAMSWRVNIEEAAQRVVAMGLAAKRA